MWVQYWITRWCKGLHTLEEPRFWIVYWTLQRNLALWRDQRSSLREDLMFTPLTTTNEQVGRAAKNVNHAIHHPSFIPEILFS